MKFLNYQEMLEEMGLQPELAPSKEEVIELWVTLGGDPDEVSEIVEGGVMIFNSQNEYETWKNQK